MKKYGDELTRDFVVVSFFEGDKKGTSAYAAGALAAMHAIGSRMHELYQEGVFSREVSKKVLDHLFEVSNQIKDA